MSRAILHVALLTLSASVTGFAFAGEAANPATDYEEIAMTINETMRAYHYNPEELDTPGYRDIEIAILALGSEAGSDDEFVDGFQAIWADGPFSHVTLNKAGQSADQLASQLDTMRVGDGGAMLTWQGDVAVLTVNTMMGFDTIEQIDAAYSVIAERDASALIIDLRENGGGAFAVRPLVSHLVSEPVDAGYFVSQPWNAAYDREPTLAELQAVDPWEGWSIRAFWADVQVEAITRIQFTPSDPVYDGPVYVLTSARTASAAELATGALKTANRATIIGENTAGEMLSQKIYDLPGGFHLSLPIADYYAIGPGRIEGAGIPPDIETNAADALDVAVSMIDQT